MKINKVSFTGGGGLFHDSRQDAKQLAKKLNECIDKINRQEQEIKELKAKLKGEEE